MSLVGSQHTVTFSHGHDGYYTIINGNRARIHNDITEGINIKQRIKYNVEVIGKDPITGNLKLELLESTNQQIYIYNPGEKKLLFLRDQNGKGYILGESDTSSVILNFEHIYKNKRHGKKLTLSTETEAKVVTKNLMLKALSWEKISKILECDNFEEIKNFLRQKFPKETDTYDRLEGLAKNYENLFPEGYLIRRQYYNSFSKNMDLWLFDNSGDIYLTEGKSILGVFQILEEQKDCYIYITQPGSFLCVISNRPHIPLGHKILQLMEKLYQKVPRDTADKLIEALENKNWAGFK